MPILRTLPDLINYLNEKKAGAGCLADTGFLYALAYRDDRLFESANDVHDILVEHQTAIYANVVSRMELIDLIFRKQVTIGCIQAFEEATVHSHHKEVYKLLKDIRDKNTIALRKKESFKVDDSRLKKIRKHLQNEYGILNWEDFCRKYVGIMLTNEWLAIEQDLGLNFVEIMEGPITDLFYSPLIWSDMVQLMGRKGLRGPDAMILNLFDKSKLQLLVTSDSDFEFCFTDPLKSDSDKAIFIL